MNGKSYEGAERRANSECPMTARQAYNMLSMLEQVALKQDKIIGQQEKMSERIGKLEQYTFIGRAVFWTLTIIGAFSAWAVGIFSDVKDVFRS